MHKLVPTSCSSIQGLYDAGENLHSHEKKIVYDEVKSVLEAKYIGYDDLTNPNRLEQLVPLWPVDDVDAGTKANSERFRKNVYDLYSRKRPFISKLWNEITMQNDGKTLLCPFCDKASVTDLDHYVPRGNFPEYSVHIKNLIPTCHECNRLKNEKWLDENRKRIFFNAYFDPLPTQSIIEAEIKLSTTSIPVIELSIKQNLDMTDEAVRLVLSTLENLNLMDRVYKNEADNLLRLRTIDIIEHCCAYHEENPLKTKLECWGSEKESIKRIMKKLLEYDWINKLVLEQILMSPIYENYVISKIV